MTKFDYKIFPFCCFTSPVRFITENKWLFADLFLFGWSGGSLHSGCVCLCVCVRLCPGLQHFLSANGFIGAAFVKQKKNKKSWRDEHHIARNGYFSLAPWNLEYLPLAALRAQIRLMQAHMKKKLFNQTKEIGANCTVHVMGRTRFGKSLYNLFGCNFEDL